MKNESIAISYCINVSEGVTNGDVIKAMFPDADFDFKANTVGIVYERKYRYSIYDVTISIGWWNAKYKGVSE